MKNERNLTMLMCDLDQGLYHARIIGRTHLLTTEGGDLLAEFHSSGAFTVRPRQPEDFPCGGWSSKLSDYASHHYGFEGWGAVWCDALVGELFVHASGAFVVKTFHEHPYQRWLAERTVELPLTTDDALRDLLDAIPE